MLAAFAHPDHLLLVGSRGLAYLLLSSNLKCLGSKHCVVTLVERKTGYALIGQLNDRTTTSTNRRTITLMSKMPEQFKTITPDNGTEFHQYKKVEEVTNCTYYINLALY
ncbi:MAG: hypothetical protein QS721_09805 [Candidatus Endonucleobacter sp. (ex Gigantidas childressi)]|nr:hypothetical protein [Candidatus Endonucleobacter sp. (ex Gigantidas childressi)]